MNGEGRVIASTSEWRVWMSNSGIDSGGSSLKNRGSDTVTV